MRMSKWNIPLILKRMLEVLMVLGPAFMIALPFIIQLKAVNHLLVADEPHTWLTFAFIEVCGVFCWLILLMLRRLLTTVIKSTPFVYENVKCLKNISYLCAAAAIVLLVKTFVNFSVMTPMIAILALLSSMFCQTLAMVFDKAVRIKDENDLTI
jgi:hypothetical protein